LTESVSAGDTEATVFPSKEELLEEAKDILARVVYLRKLDFTKPPEIQVIDREKLHEVLKCDFERETPPEQLEAIQKSLAKLGFIPEDYSLKEALLEILAENVGGAYDPRSKVLYLVNRWSLPVQRFIIAHEGTHLLQDHHHDIISMPISDKHNDDLALVARSVLEGDAVLLSTKYLEMLPLLKRIGVLGRVAAEGYFGAGSITGMSPSLKNAPDYIRDQLLFPYFKGAMLVTLCHTLDEWKGVERMYSDPPLSTEQIMHPMKFIGRRDDPVLIGLPDLSAKLTGWSLLTHNCAGEFGIDSLLKSHLTRNTENLAAIYAQLEQASAGWDGDRYQLYEHKESGRLAVAWFTTWDSARDAEEFANSYAKLVDTRYAKSIEKGMHQTTTKDHRERRISKWLLKENGQVIVIRSSRDVLVVDGFSVSEGSKAVDALLDGVRRSPVVWSAPTTEVSGP